MLIPGLVSVTFRQKSRGEIAELMRRASLPSIEWGGDVHVPTAESETAEGVREAVEYSSDGGFYICSYGSYYRCDGESLLYGKTAASLHAPNIRVWAGQKGSADADESYRAGIVSCIRRLCDDMSGRGITVSTEFHSGTLTDNYESALRLIDEVERDNFFTYWQPNQFRDEEYNLAALRVVLPYLSNVHVFTWDSSHRYALEDGEMRWRKYIDIIRSSDKIPDLPHHMLLEFVKDDSDGQFLRDAEVLKKWLE